MLSATPGRSELPFRAARGGQCHGAGVAGGLLFLPNDFQLKLSAKHPDYPGAISIVGPRGEDRAGFQLQVASAEALRREEGDSNQQVPKARQREGLGNPCSVLDRTLTYTIMYPNMSKTSPASHSLLMTNAERQGTGCSQVASILP